MVKCMKDNGMKDYSMVKENIFIQIKLLNIAFTIMEKDKDI